IGPNAREAVPALRGLLRTTDDSTNRELCLLALADIGPAAKQAISDIEPLLIDPDPRLRMAAACAAAWIRKDVGPYRAMFTRTMRKSVDGLNRDALSRIAPMCPEFAPIAIRKLSAPQTNWSEPRAYLGIIDRITPKPTDAIPDLVELLSGSDMYTLEH